MFETSGLKLFEIRGIPVSASFGFGFLMIFILVLNSIESGLPLVFAITLSLLIHEFGHAVVSKYYKLNPSILLHGFGGLCFHDVADSDRKDALIVVMGPVIEIIFGALAIVGLMIAPLGFFEQSALLMFAKNFLVSFAYVSIIWGAANLFLPIWPLDGGKLFLLILRRFMEPRRAESITLKASMVVAIPIGALALYGGQLFLGLVVFFIVMDNYQSMQSGVPLIQRSGAVPSRGAAKANDYVQSLLDDSKAAMADENWREAARLCHQIRSTSSTIPKKTMEQIWEILGVTTTKMGEYEEALNYLKRAPDTSAVKQARQICEEAIAAQKAQGEIW